MDLNEHQLHILRHSLGLRHDGSGTQYRNHYVCNAGGVDGERLKILCKAGLMEDGGAREMLGGMHLFWVTDAGKAELEKHAPPPEKLTRAQRRYREFLKQDTGMSFGQWLRQIKNRIRT